MRFGLINTLKACLTMGLMGLILVSALPAARARKFQAALPGYRFQFPQDYGNHPGYKTEWWYYTGHLHAPKTGEDFGFELTFFRTEVDLDQDHASDIEGKPSSWRLLTLYPAHFALTDETHQRFLMAEKLTRGFQDTSHENGAGQAGTVAANDVQGFKVWNQGWSTTISNNGQTQLLADMPARGAVIPEARLALELTQIKPPTLHGENGVSQKAGCVGCASHYFSQSRLPTTGTLTLNGKALQVIGITWMDHEYGSNQLAANQVGWDWFSVQLDDRSELMLYRMRQKNGTSDPFSSGSVIGPYGQVTHLTQNQFQVSGTGSWTSLRTGGVYPMGWHLEIPSQHLDLMVTPTLKNQELVTGRSTQVSYWEGSCKVAGKRDQKPVFGKAYVEMTGYAKPFRQKL